jgi:hypothetical protein
MAFSSGFPMRSPSTWVPSLAPSIREPSAGWIEPSGRSPPRARSTGGSFGANAPKPLSRPTRVSSLKKSAAVRDAIPVPAFGPRMVCTGCGTVGAGIRPNSPGSLAPHGMR